MLAMHIPDGFLDGQTSLVGGLVAIAGVAFCLRRTSQTLDERDIPVVGLVAAFVFAVQMLNFPVVNGTSGHLMGGVLAAVLVGPYAGALAVTVVLVVQALLFADGGLSALGLNVVNMALIGAFAGYGIFLLVRKLSSSVTIAAGLAGFTAPVLASIGFTLQYAVGGNDAVSVGSLATAMIGVHTLIGIGEGIITALAVGSVMAMRPDLVYGARGTPRPVPTAVLVGVGIVTAVLLVVFVAPWANPNPDGLERVAADNGVDAAVTDHDLAGSPLADYGVEGVDNAMFGTGLAGVAGIAVTLAVGAGLLWIVRRRRDSLGAAGGRSERVMGGRHRHLVLHHEGPLHRLPPQCKLLATLLFVFAVVATPKEQLWAFGTYAGLIVAAALIGSVPILVVARRLVIEVPFLLFAVLLPFVGGEPRVDVLGLSLSEAGLWAAWNIVVKGTLGVAATVVMASTTSIPHILAGLERLRVPRTLVAITAFMIRYGDVIGDELRRMRIARESRGGGSGLVGQARAVATSAGALFVRSYERGERVYLAMASRGYVGSMPVRDAPATVSSWLVCMLWPLAAVVVAASAWSMQ